jgi:hypothetical protein
MKSSLLEKHPARPVGAYELPSSESYSEWAIEPKANGWRGWFDQLTGIGYNRHGQFASNQNLMAERLANCGIKSRWIDCEIMGMREKKGLGTIIIIDAFDPENPKPYAERVKEFEHITPAPFELPTNSLLRMPRLDHSRLKQIWEEMNAQNVGGLVWEGFVMKNDNFATPPYPSPPTALTNGTNIASYDSLFCNLLWPPHDARALPFCSTHRPTKL